MSLGRKKDGRDVERLDALKVLLDDGHRAFLECPVIQEDFKSLYDLFGKGSRRETMFRIWDLL